MRILGLLGLVLGLAAATPTVAAPAANPELVARDYVSDGGQPRSEQLRIGGFDLKVHISGGVAYSVATVHFDNPSARNVEGDFTLDLPVGSTVTGYALDINGVMVDGVLVAERKARLAYEAQVRRGIDPGLATVDRAGAFRTRVFPIMAGKGRTIRIAFVTALSADTPFVLPLETGKAVGSLSISVTGDDLAAVPVITGPAGLKIQAGGAAATARDVKLSGALTIGPVKRAAAMLTSRHHDGDAFFEIDDTVRTVTGALPTEHVRVYWDRSLSRRDDDVKAERALLEAWLRRAKPKSIEIVQFNAGGTTRDYLDEGDVVAAMSALLDGVDYAGASSWKTATGRPDLAPADACVVVSDGVFNVDGYGPGTLDCPVFTVSSAADANRAWLRAMAARAGGEHLDLTTAPVEQLVERLTREAPRVVAVETADGKPVDYVLLPASAGRIRLVGRLPGDGPLTVKLASAGERGRTYTPAAGEPRRHDGLGVLWARERLGELNATDRPDPEASLAFARRFGIASPEASFIVLERTGDYVEAKIEPPASLGKEVGEAYRAAMADIERAERKKKDERIDDVLDLWVAQKAWWNTTFEPRARAKGWNDESDVSSVVVTARRRGGGEPSAPPPPPPPPPSPVMAAPMMEAAPAPGNVAADALPTALARPTPPAPAATSGRTMSVEIEPWNPDRPYLVALKTAKAGDWQRVFDKQATEHGALPAFWLDVAEYLFREGRVEEARAAALTALELPIADSTTLAIVADRMSRYGDDGRAVWLRERMLFLEPDRPQPRRDLALALVDKAERKGATPAEAKADYQRALELLTEVVSTPWRNAYDGVEVISLMEANRIIPKLAALGVTEIPLDSRLVAVLDVDLRVVMEWNTDITDMDLWIDEPNGERAIYNNPDTAMGGRLSNDMTAGYGPEEYLLRRAPKGDFEIRANVYASDRLNPNGPTVIKVRIFRAWARPDEQGETLEIELKPGESGGRYLGKVTVGARPK